MSGTTRRNGAAVKKSRRTKPPLSVEVQEVLELAGQIMRRQKRTQLEIQEELGWGRSYISQLMNGQKSLRVDQLFTLLNALRVRPAEFFSELYGLRPQEEVARIDEVVALGQRIQELTNGLDRVGLRLDQLEGLDQAEPGQEKDSWPEDDGESLRFPRILGG